MKMPEADDVVFKVGATKTAFGWYQWDGKQHTITASIKAIGHTSTLLQLMAHEAIHLYLEHTKQENRSGNCNIHNAAFKRIAAKVCRTHGFDPKAFY
jgi:hypothetical protein